MKPLFPCLYQWYHHQHCWTNLYVPFLCPLFDDSKMLSLISLLKLCAAAALLSLIWETKDVWISHSFDNLLCRGGKNLVLLDLYPGCTYDLLRWSPSYNWSKIQVSNDLTSMFWQYYFNLSSSCTQCRWTVTLFSKLYLTQCSL